jgi:uncharacterized protein YukE
MSAIQMNFNTLRRVAKAIDEYCSYQDAQMRQADFDIKSMLSTDWLGDDATAFSRNWEGVNSDNSEAVKFRNSLLKYCELLAVSANEYRTAQKSAQNEATRLQASLFP